MGALDNKPFGVTTSDGSMGDKGIAMQADPRYTGDNGQDEKFEGTKPGATSSASQAQFTGRQ
jgi:hypothetical protein